MQAAPFMTPNPQYNVEQILIRSQYKAIFNSIFYNIIIEKTNNNIIIRNNYYELKLNIQALSLLTSTIFNSIDQAYEFIINIFNQNKFYIKELLSNKIILTIGIFDIIGNQKEIDLELKENFEDKNYLIKELFNNYVKLENNINYVNNDNKLLKEENKNLKNEINNIKQNYNNEINQLKMAIMNYTNMINQMQQQLNQFNNIYQEINNIKNQINNVSMSMNSINFNNQLSSNNIINDNENDRMIRVIFRSRKSNEDQDQSNFFIKCNPEDNIKELIRQYRTSSGDNLHNRKFIYNAENLNRSSHLTIKEIGITNNANIFVVKFQIINFRISDDYFYIMPFSEKSKLSKLREDFLKNTGLTSNDYINFSYNNKILNMALTAEESGIKDNSDIIVKLKNKTLDFINIRFQREFFDANPTVIKCLKKEKLSQIIERYKVKTSQKNCSFRFLIKSSEIDEIDRLKSELENWTAEDFGLENNSIILYYKVNSGLE